MSPLHRKLAGASVPVAVLAFAVMLSNSLRVRADDVKEDNGGGDEARIELGIRMAPVPLNLTGKSRDMVGLGSYLVNAVGDCNACHNAGPGNNQFVPGGNPFFGQPKKVNPFTYLGGGRNFGPLVPGSANIISRNLTPDKTGLPEGGDTFEEFSQIMTTGVDLDHAHPTCPVGVVNPGCVPLPFDGDLLQVMPWPGLKEMSERDLRAIYEYLSAIPCLEGGPGEPANRCNNPPIGFIDTPKENDSVSSGSWAFGWALDDSGIASVSAALDNGPATQALTGQFYPGVKEAYPNLPNADKAGFGFPIPAAAVGPHLLVVTITANDGGKTELKRQITIK
jgi:hypothetical protein